MYILYIYNACVHNICVHICIYICVYIYIYAYICCIYIYIRAVLFPRHIYSVLQAYKAYLKHKGRVIAYSCIIMHTEL